MLWNWSGDDEDTLAFVSPDSDPTTRRLELAGRAESLTVTNGGLCVGITTDADESSGAIVKVEGDRVSTLDETTLHMQIYLSPRTTSCTSRVPMDSGCLIPVRGWFWLTGS